MSTRFSELQKFSLCNLGIVTIKTIEGSGPPCCITKLLVVFARGLMKVWEESVGVPHVCKG